MIALTRTVLALGFGLALFAGCSGSDETKPTAAGSNSQANTGKEKTGGGTNTPATSSSSGSDAGLGDSSSSTPTSDGAVDTANCVPKGYAGNEKKIGAYCDNDTACPFQFEPFLICTAGHDPTNTHLFCTTPCSKDEECGTGAYCMHDTGGSGCVPTQCGGKAGN